MILCNFISLRAFNVYMENSPRFEISLRSIWPKWNFTEVSFTLPEVMWTLIMKLLCIEVKFYPEVKSQTGLSSLRVSCKRALNDINSRVKSNIAATYRPETVQKKQNMDKLEDFLLKERLLDEKVWHYNVCHAGECTLCIYYLC